MKEREDLYSETACPGIIFVGRLLLKRTTLYDTMESSSFILSDVVVHQAHVLCFITKSLALGTVFLDDIA